MADVCNECGASKRRGSLQPSDHIDGCPWYIAPRSRTTRRGGAGEQAAPGSGVGDKSVSGKDHKHKYEFVRSYQGPVYKKHALSTTKYRDVTRVYHCSRNGCTQPDTTEVTTVIVN